MARILAFDYGKKRVGVSVTDPLQIIANTLDTVSTQQIFAFIKEYCSREEVEAFVVGYPYTHGHTQNEIAEYIDKFIARLNLLYPDKQVYKIDESFTSKIAQQTLLMSGVNKKERRNKGHLDAISSNLILQTYLEMKK
ncbi:MAG: Holliday junction resolvase RuvX [Chitinophagales bacterium]